MEAGPEEHPVECSVRIWEQASPGPIGGHSFGTSSPILGEEWVSLPPAEPPGHGKAQLQGAMLLLCLSQQIHGPSTSLLFCLGSGLTPLEQLLAKADAHTARLRLIHRSMRRFKGGFIQIPAQGLWDRDLTRL